MSLEAASVSELVNSIKSTLEDQFHEVMVQGEITNLSPSAAGHWYFNLSDENACISCALFKSDAFRNPLISKLKNGDKIVIVGPISVFQKRGTFQILVKRLLPAGEGQLRLQYEKLKAKLSAEGVFDLEKKRPLPLFPQRIAVITAQHGAALQDFLNVINRRSIWVDVVIVPALVQGEGSAKSLINALNKALQLKDVEVIVLTRGGGSMEDLWSFNDEQLVRAVAASPIPVVSAVGHQVDYTLCDYAADHRSETPTAAAETLSQPQTELKARLNFCHSHLKSEVFKTGQHVQLIIQKFHPRELQGLIWQKLQSSQKRLASVRLRDRAPELIGHHDASQLLDESLIKLMHAEKINISNNKHHLQRLEQVLTALGPQQVLMRGYSFVKNEGGEVVTSLQQYTNTAPGSKLKLHFHDGAGTAIKEIP